MKQPTSKDLAVDLDIIHSYLPLQHFCSTAAYSVGSAGKIMSHSKEFEHICHWHQWSCIIKQSLKHPKDKSCCVWFCFFVCLFFLAGDLWWVDEMSVFLLIHEISEWIFCWFIKASEPSLLSYRQLKVGFWLQALVFLA